jgi:hypothetical protein
MRHPLISAPLLTSPCAARRQHGGSGAGQDGGQELGHLAGARLVLGEEVADHRPSGRVVGMAPGRLGGRHGVAVRAQDVGGVAGTATGRGII